MLILNIHNSIFIIDKKKNDSSTHQLTKEFKCVVYSYDSISSGNNKK